MSSSPAQHIMNITVVATQELCIRVEEPAVPAGIPESIPQMVLEQLARRGLNLASIQVASNPGSLGGLPAGQELASAALKDSAVFHMFNRDRSLPAWNRLPSNMPNKIPLWDKEKRSAACQLGSSTQKPVTWFYDPIPHPEANELWLSGTRFRSFADHLIAKDNLATTDDDGPAPPVSVSNSEGPEPMEEISSSTAHCANGGKEKRRDRKKARTLQLQHHQPPKRATKLLEARVHKNAAAKVEKETGRSGKGTLIISNPERRKAARVAARIQDAQHFATRVDRLGITKALDVHGHKREREVKRRLERATERRWRGQPSDLTEDDKVDVITKELQKTL